MYILVAPNGAIIFLTIIYCINPVLPIGATEIYHLYIIRMTNKKWTLIHQNRYSSLYTYLKVQLNMDIIYDDFIETYKRELMSIVEKSKKQTLLIIAMEQKKSGYLWLQDIYIYMVMIDIQNYVQKLDINI